MSSCSRSGIWFLFAAVLAGLLFMPGCSFFTPGADVRHAAEARSETVWDSESNLRLSENTTHNRRVTMAESADSAIVAEYYADGTPKRIEGASQVLTQASEPRDAMQGYMLLAQENAKAYSATLDLIGSLIPLIGQRSTAAPAGGGLAEIWSGLTPEERAAILDRLGIVAPTPAPNEGD